MSDPQNISGKGLALKMKRRKYWYFITYSECPVCGRQFKTERERRYGRKPLKWWTDTHAFKDKYCGCEP